MIVILGIDGMSSETFTAGMPHLTELHRLFNVSAYSMHARAEQSARSSENWGTHMYGNGPAYHGWYRSYKPPAVSGAISIFDVVQNSIGCTKWPPLSLRTPKFHVGDVTPCALAAIQNRSNDLVFAIWDEVDAAAHAGSSQQSALQHVDGEIGKVLAHVDSSDHIIVVSDHGSRACSTWDHFCVAHYGARVTEMDTPLLITGPTIAPGPLARRVTHQDTSHYVLRLLNLPTPCDWQLGGITTCNSSWPGEVRDVIVHEESLRDEMNTATWVALPVIFVLMLLLCWLGCQPRARQRAGFIHL